jgi:hypothetical protein
MICRNIRAHQLPTSRLPPRPDNRGYVLTFPELLRRILARNSLQDLRPPRVFIDEGRHVVDGLVYDDVNALLRAVVRLDFLGADRFRHGGRMEGGSAEMDREIV